MLLGAKNEAEKKHSSSRIHVWLLQLQPLKNETIQQLSATQYKTKLSEKDVSAYI